jgi:hypothetical protein
VEGAEVGVLKKADKVGLGRLLQRAHGRRLEAQVPPELLGNFADQALEGQLADQQIRALLEAADLTQGDGARAVAVGLLHAGGWLISGAFGLALRARGLDRGVFLRGHVFRAGHDGGAECTQQRCWSESGGVDVVSPKCNRRETDKKDAGVARKRTAGMSRGRGTDADETADFSQQFCSGAGVRAAMDSTTPTTKDPMTMTMDEYLAWAGCAPVPKTDITDVGLLLYWADVNLRHGRFAGLQELKEQMFPDKGDILPKYTVTCNYGENGQYISTEATATGTPVDEIGNMYEVYEKELSMHDPLSGCFYSYGWDKRFEVRKKFMDRKEGGFSLQVLVCVGERNSSDKIDMVCALERVNVEVRGTKRVEAAAREAAHVVGKYAHHLYDNVRRVCDHRRVELMVYFGEPPVTGKLPVTRKRKADKR